jgi:hypothetical protein
MKIMSVKMNLEIKQKHNNIEAKIKKNACSLHLKILRRNTHTETQTDGRDLL